MLQVSKALFVAAAVGFLAGVGALVGSLGPSGWSELSDGFVWYLQGRSPLLLLAPLGGLCLGAAVILALVARREARSGVIVKDHDQRGASQELSQEAQRSKPKLEQVIDLLLGVPVDLGATGLSMAPAGAGAPSTIEVALALGDLHLPVTTMRQALYDEVLKELRQMARIGEAGEGVVKLQSTRRRDRLRVVLTHQAAGIAATIEVLGESVSEAQALVGRPRSNSVVFRLEPALRNIITGELQMPLDPSSAQDRPVGRLETTLRLVLASLVTLLVVFFFWNAYAWAVAMLFTGGGPSWRVVSLRVESSPVPGNVNIEGQARGRTPLDISTPCRGRAIKILVQAKGYATWQWNGVCPDQGRLELRARLKPLSDRAPAR